MNKIHLILITFLFSINSYAQIYHPFLEDGKEWLRSSTEYNGVAGPPTTDYWSYYSQGDTLVNGVLYQKFDGGDILLREDLTTQQVIRLYTDNEECIVYDFGAEVGDTVVACNYIGDYVIYKDTTIELLNGEYRRAFYTSDHPFSSYTYIEGIGGDGFERFYSTHMMDYYSSVVCVKQGANYLYGNGCGYYTPLNFKDVKMFPNPAKSFIELSGLEDDYEKKVELLKVEFFDLKGRIVFSVIDNFERINISKLNSGVYLVRLTTKDETIIKKLIKD